MCNEHLQGAGKGKKVSKNHQLSKNRCWGGSKKKEREQRNEKVERLTGNSVLGGRHRNWDKQKKEEEKRGSDLASLRTSS